ncbi:homeobox protein 12 [Morus notabilis]|uniref:homeobox protein 12 n=1 Tax=Morus notabilis TaxID=981085 RepID=UPI000CED0A95|nr:homeobox protein 12 [Morus notabilis]
MSSDLFIFDGSFYHHSSSPEMLVSSEAELFFNDNEFSSPFSDSAIDILQALSDPIQQQSQSQNQNQNPLLDQPQISPPTQELQSLNLYHPNLENGIANLDAFQIKTEECHLGTFENINSFYNNNENNDYNNSYNYSISGSDHSQVVQFGPHSYSGVQNVAKFMQRSCSSSGFLFSPSVESSSTFGNQASFSSPENNNNNAILNGHMRRVCSTGDLQNFGTTRTTQRSFSSPLANSESSFMEEANFKVGKYSAEERKERISKYRAKRTLRNFNKTIKYACRKTLADNRPRIRGRFARNDEPGFGETPKAPSSSRDEDEDDLWLEGLHEEEEDNETAMRGQFLNSTYGPTQFQYYGF